MWSRTLFLQVRIRVLKGGRGFRLRLPVALYPLSGLLLSADPVLSMLPGSFGAQVRTMTDALHAAVYALEDSEPQEFVHVDVEDGESSVLVDVRTLGSP